jgi:hypothetical protein
MTTDAEHVSKIEQGEAATVDQRPQPRAARGGPMRRSFVGVLVVLFSVLLPLTVTAGWVHRTVLNTDSYVATVAPVAKDPAVIAAVSRQITDQLYTALDPQTSIASALPPRAAFLATPIANGARDYVQQGVNKVLSSDQFQQLWTGANRFAHAQLVAVLRGDSTVLQATNGAVVLNLVPLVNRALQRSETFVSAVVGKQVQLPTVTTGPPAEVCAKIASALDRPLPDTCGQITLFRSAQLDTARQAVKTFDRAVLALLIITPLVAILVLWLSRRRRRTLLQMTIGAMLGLVLVRRVLMWEQNQLLDVGRPENRDARRAILDHVLGGFYTLTWWVLVVGLVVLATALVTGPYRWARSLRSHVATGSRRGWLLLTAVRRGQAEDASAADVAWVRAHFDLLRVSGVVVAVLLLLTLSLNFWGVLVVAALLGLYEASLHRLRPPESITLPPPTATA